MAYTKTLWKARQGTGLKRFLKSEETAEYVELTAAPLSITEAGTSFSAENMNNIEDGIEAAHLAIAALGGNPEGLPVANNTGSLGFVTGEEDIEANDGMITVQSTGKMKLIGFERLEKRIVGKTQSFLRALSDWELATNRLLKMEGQLIEIALYPDLCAAMYVGDSANATADWWYKCNSSGTRTTSGAYMCVADTRGLFFRNAGANSKYRAANNTPYDGKVVGRFSPDTTRTINAGFGYTGNRISPFIFLNNTQGWSQNDIDASVKVSSGRGILDSAFDIILNGNFANETAGAWLAVNTFITY